jgi:hypothetical protein
MCVEVLQQYAAARTQSGLLASMFGIDGTWPTPVAGVSTRALKSTGMQQVHASLYLSGDPCGPANDHDGERL